jgi:hypothetical protein
MPVSCEVKRTLVKSPPELWSELSDPQSLARHLGDLGEIRIVRAEAEKAVEWEAAGATGSVRLEPSGFGTKVTLSLSRETAEPAAQPATVAPAANPATVEPGRGAVEPGPEAFEPEAIKEEPEPIEPAAVAAEPWVVTPDPEAVEPEPEAVAVEPATVGEPEPTVESEPAERALAPAVDPQPRAGFFARLFKRRRHQPLAEEPQAIDEPHVIDELSVADEPEPPLEPTPLALEPPLAPEPPLPPTPEPSGEQSEEAEAVADEQPMPDLTTDLATLEAEMAEQDEVMLTAMLDRLGAAHHRPFSRA